MFWLVLFIFGAVCLSVLLILLISNAFLRIKIKNFKKNFAHISLSMTKEQVIELMGEKYTTNVSFEKEVFVWKQKCNSFMERELLTQHQQSTLTATVSFVNGFVVAYSLS